MVKRDRPARDPRSFLPLTPRAFEVMLALAPGPLHGYAVIQEVARLSEGVIVMRTGTLYLLLQRLRGQGLIEPTDERPPARDDDERRQYYVLTSLGRSVLEAEVQRLRVVMGAARRQGLHWGKP
jgi:DNA-binding PadR family transcriptional regulator